MTSSPNKLWVRIMKDKYVKNGNFLTSGAGNNALWGWKIITQGRNIIERGAIWQVGDGRSIEFWSNGWVTEEPLGLHHDITIPEDLYHAKVCDFILPTQSWDFSKLQTFLPEHILNKICAIPIERVVS